MRVPRRVHSKKRWTIQEVDNGSSGDGLVLGSSDVREYHPLACHHLLDGSKTRGVQRLLDRTIDPFRPLLEFIPGHSVGW